MPDKFPCCESSLCEPLKTIPTFKNLVLSWHICLHSYLNLLSLYLIQFSSRHMDVQVVFNKLLPAISMKANTRYYFLLSQNIL